METSTKCPTCQGGSAHHAVMDTKKAPKAKKARNWSEKSKLRFKIMSSLHKQGVPFKDIAKQAQETLRLMETKTE